ncbi:MAG: hypothetical protein JNK78_02830 [Planctomycetes bacterium]|nr:hypothetical protein [Planctomycetota bacterium]
MLRALEIEPHDARLRALLQRFRAEEQGMNEALHELQSSLEHWHREANFLRTISPGEAEAMLRRCTDLQAECDAIAIELVHVRMAVAGTAEELAEHEGRLVRGRRTEALVAAPA